MVASAGSGKKFSLLDKTALELQPLSAFLAKIIFVKFSFSEQAPDKSYIFEKATLLGGKISWECRFLGQQPYFCIKNCIVMVFLVKLTKT